MARPRQGATDQQQGNRGNWQRALLRENPEEQDGIPVPDHELGRLIHMDLRFNPAIKDSLWRVLRHTLKVYKGV
jgi:hypothetical protein